MHNRDVILLGMMLVASCRTIATPDEQALTRRDQQRNGITVLKPKVYDDVLLQQQLLATEARLASLNLLDQTGIASRIGSIAGARQDVTSFGVSATGTPAPGAVVTANGATKSVQDTLKDTDQVVTTTTTPVQNTVTTIPGVAANIPTPAGASIPLPATPGASASHVLDEQMQLTDEIANLRLLLAGALSDQLFQDSDLKTYFKPHITLGFPIAITPDDRYRDAAAIIEIVIDANPDEDLSGGTQPPEITALLPREKTYNVAAISERNTSIGAGVVTQVASLGASFLHGQKSYYIVKDQDTIARLLPPTPSQFPVTSAALSPARNLSRPVGLSPAFAWEFRPVLGQAAVVSGLKQTFVQVAFAAPRATTLFGNARITTYWRRYDRNTGLLKGIIPGSLNTLGPMPIQGFNLTPVASVSPVNLEDLGNGQMLVKVPGPFLNGTSVRIGATLLAPGAGLTADNQQLRFVATIADLATKPVQIVAPDGSETPLEIVPPKEAPTSFRISAAVTPIDETNSLVAIETVPPDPIPGFPLLTIVLGGKVFGYADAPIDHAHGRLAITVPTAILLANRTVTVKPLLASRRLSATAQLVATDAIPLHLTLVAQSTDASYLLTGANVREYTVRIPNGHPLQAIGASSDAALLTLPIAEATMLKMLVLQRGSERPIALALPPLTDPVPVPLHFVERVTVGADDATIAGTGATDVVKVLALGHTITTVEPGAEKDSLIVHGLAAAGITTTAKTVSCDAVNSKGKKTTVPLEIINTKVETIAH
jgi:hypothetical protein